ncbi:MAG: hypothetical protein ACTSRP_10740 [Candidatus Helarchaeota archaeon]
MFSINKIKEFLRKKLNLTLFNLVVVFSILLFVSIVFIYKDSLPENLSQIIINEWYIALILHLPEFVIFTFAFSGVIYLLLKKEKLKNSFERNFLKIIFSFGAIVITFIIISLFLESFFIEYSRFLTFLYFLIVIFSNLFIITRNKNIIYIIFISSILIPISIISSIYNVYPNNKYDYETCIWLKNNSDPNDKIVCYPPGRLQNMIRGVAERVSEQWVDEIFFRYSDLETQWHIGINMSIDFLILFKLYNYSYCIPYYNSTYFILIYENPEYLIFYLLK